MQPRFAQSLFLSIGTLILVLWIAAGGLIYYLGQSMRVTVREQMLSRDAYVLSALSDLESSEGDDLPLKDRWLAFVENASELRDILGVRLTDFESRYHESLPKGILASEHSASDLALLQGGTPIDRFIDDQPLDLLFEGVGIEEIGESIPVVELSLPLYYVDGKPTAYVHFWIDGTSMAEEFRELDRDLEARGLAIWALIGLVLLTGGSIAFVVIRRLNRSLEQRSLQLERSNQELQLAARSSAIGAITGHLMHGLKNPLAGLQSYLRATSDPDAQSAAERMQSIVNETLSALRLESRSSKAAIGVNELRRLIEKDCSESFQRGGLILKFEPWDASIELPLRELNLLSLVLKNLIQNAAEVSTEGDVVTLGLSSVEGRVRVTISDCGPGVDREIQPQLFTPLVSAKAGGTGLGLALSKQMMRSIGGDLKLLASDKNGSVFEITLQLALKEVFEA